MGDTLIDGTLAWTGFNAGLTADRIQKSEAHTAINATFKNNSVGCRDKFIHKPITVTSAGKELGISYQDIFDKGKFQGERQLVQGTEKYLISVRGGIIFKVDLKRQVAQVLRTFTDDRISKYHRRVNIGPAGRYMVIHDWPNMPVIIDNGKARRSNHYAVDFRNLPAPEIPASRMGVFLQDRYWIANTSQFTAGDRIGVVDTAPLSFIEVLTQNAAFVNQFFNLGYGFSNQDITAMGYISSRNSQSKIQSTDYGPLYLATRGSFHIYSAEIPRDLWMTTNNFGRLELKGVGVVGQRAHSIIGSDVMFQDIHGQVHSLTKNQNDVRSGWSTTIISREVSNWLHDCNKDYLDIGIITHHKDRVYIGAKPARRIISQYRGQIEYDYYHQGIAVLELNNASTLNEQATPAWAGLWSGINPMEITSVDDELYITSKDADGFNRTYLVDENAEFDEVFNTKKPVRSRIYLRAYDCEQPLRDKKEQSVELSMGRIRKALKVLVYRKPLHLWKYALWNKFEFNPICRPPSCDGGFAPGVAAGFKGIFFGDSIDKPCNTVTNEPGTVFRESQVMIDITGSDWKLDKVKFKATAEGESESGQSPVVDETLPPADCKFVHDLEMYKLVETNE
jgi:hypothetical protein